MNFPSIARLGVILLLPVSWAHAADEWRPLFNGRDLAGWETFLARPHASTDVPGLKRNEKGAYLEAIGLDRDPLGNFTVTEVDGRPAVRISGQGFGCMTTRENFANYHLRLQFKWGEKKWPPRAQAVRDSGVLYHVHGEPAASDRVWPASVELQIQEKDCGDLYAIVTRVTVPARSFVTPENRTLYQYDPAAAPVDFKQERPIGNRCIRLADFEKPAGEWNTIELICIGGDSIHIVNGHVVMRLSDARQKGANGEWPPLAAGRIALQTEGAEIYYRDVELRPISAVPAEFRE
jgi:hypothetical protein